jgi:hypothetical protein
MDPDENMADDFHMEDQDYIKAENVPLEVSAFLEEANMPKKKKRHLSKTVKYEDACMFDEQRPTHPNLRFANMSHRRNQKYSMIKGMVKGEFD